MEHTRDIVDESFPYLSDQSSLADLTINPTLGTPVAVSTVAKIRTAVENRRADDQTSTLETQDGSRDNCSSEEGPRFQLSFKDDLGDAEDFLAAKCLSGMLVKGSSEESASKPIRVSRTAFSAGLLNFTNISQNDIDLEWEEPSQDTTGDSASTLQADQSSLHLPAGNPPAVEDWVVEEYPGGRCIQQQRNREATVVCNNSSSDDNSEGPSLDVKYFRQSFNEEEAEAESWNHFPEDLDFRQGGEDGNHSVVYQNEEGQWVTDLAYYSSFQKEFESHPTKEVSSHFQKEDFCSGSKAMDKIAEDQEEFEKEHRFIQEDQMQVNNSVNIADSSWRLPTSSHILMRASGISSELASGSPSYLRLSLGEFFQQRSEALGCLGSEEDEVKRPSFGYIITSPERREPFPLIRPSDISSRDSPALSDTVALSDPDEPMNADDLEKTRDDKIDRTLTDPDAQLPPSDKPNGKALNHTILLEKDDDQMAADTVCEVDSPGTANNNIDLSISTIASAIANASLSSDPAQLAAMIIRLSQRSHVHDEKENQDVKRLSRPDQKSATPATAVVAVEAARDTSVVSDMEKYLHRVELSGSESEIHASQSCVDILGFMNASHDLSQKTAGLLSKRDAESGYENSADIEKLSNAERTKSFSSSTTLPSFLPSGSSDNLAAVCQLDEGNGVTGMPQPDVDQFSGLLQVASPRNCNFTKSGESSLHSELRSSPKLVSPHMKQVDTDTCTNSSEGSATVKFRDTTSSWGTEESLKEIMSPHEHTTPPVHTQSFRPSTFPLTHSSPSQNSLKTREGVLSPVPSEELAKSTFVETSSPESQHSDLSLSRLTYLSINDGHSVLDHKKNVTMELSTTIIRASPTPEEDKGTRPKQDLEDIPEESSSRNSVDSLTSGKAYSLDHHHHHSQNGHHLDVQRSKDLKLDKLAIATPCSELHQQCGGYVSNCGCMSSNLNLQSHPAVSTDVGFLRPSYPKPWHVAPGGPGVAQCAARTSPAYSNTPDLCYAPPMSNYGSHAPLLHVDHPHSMPACLSRGVDSLFSMNSGSQPCLDGDLIPPRLADYLGGGCGGAGGARPLLPAALSSAHFNSTHQCCRKPYGQQHHSQWLSTDFTGVIVPDELKFPSPCCVGIASQVPLSIFNPFDRWLQVSISVSTLSIDGQQMDITPYQWLVVKNKTVVGPKSTEEQKVLFIPPQAGVYRCTLHVLSWPASAEPEVSPATGSSKHVFFTGVAENPTIEVDIGKAGCLHFGDLPSGSSKTLPLRLINRTHAVVPIRLVMNANPSVLRCFTFSKNPLVDGAAHPTNLRPVPSVVNYVLRANDGENPEVLMIWVHFQAPQLYTCTTGELWPADEFTAQINVEVDRPGPSWGIQSVGLKARSGVARVHAPRHLQTVTLHAPLGQSVQQTLPLKNAGSIDVQLRLKCSNSFSVEPSELMLCVGEEQGIVVSFTPKEKQKCDESVLTILVLPSGPQYEVVLKGEVVLDANTKPVLPSSSAASQCQVPPILSNKQFIAWGGVTLGMAMQQKLVLRNNSTSMSQQLRLLIRGQDQDCFQLQSSFGPEERLSHVRELTIRPKEDATVHLLFTPSRVACMLAKLEIKQSSLKSSQPGIKFTIPLSGYGGISNIILEDLEKFSEGYVSTLTGVRVGSISKLCVCVRNTGSRAAYVRAVVYTDPQLSQLAETTIFSLAPAQFVLKERSKEVITVLLKTTAREQALCQSKPPVLATVCLFCGDEISRQRYKRFQKSKPLAGQKIVSDNSKLKDLCFDEVFLGEDNINEVCDLPQRPSEGQMFFSGMKRVMLTLLGTADSADSGNQMQYLHMSLGHGTTESHSPLEATSDGQSSHVSLDVLPVKGPPLEVKESPDVAVDQRRASWSIKPELVVLRAPAIGGDTDTCQLQLVNHLGFELSFELSWPAHCLVITPQNGVVEPEGYVSIHVSPNPCLVSKPLQLPWHGVIYVLCDGQQKFVKVQIQQDSSKGVSVSAVSDKLPLSALTQAEVGAFSLVKKQPTTGTCSQLEIANSNLFFPVTPCGESTECFLKVENRGEEVRWYLSSLAPPYVKGVDDTEDVFHANYSAFRCPKVFGVLGTQTNMQVPFTFIPREAGVYAQLWDLECHPVDKQHQKSRLRFQLCGTAVKSASGACIPEADPILPPAEASTQVNKRPDLTTAKTAAEESLRRGVYAPQDLYTFPVTQLGQAHTLKVNFRNNSFDTYELTFISPKAPFHIKHKKYSLRSQHYINLPVQFKPTAPGSHVGFLCVQVGAGARLTIQLVGEASS